MSRRNGERNEETKQRRVTKRVREQQYADRKHRYVPHPFLSSNPIFPNIYPFQHNQTIPSINKQLINLDLLGYLSYAAYRPQ